MLYKDPHRKNGSQREIPSYKFVDGRCHVNGYQTFVISKDEVKLGSAYSSKFKYIKEFLEKHIKDCESVTDIGANNGLVCFVASMNGYKLVYALDHDIDCIHMITAIQRDLAIELIKPIEYSFGDEHLSTDIVIVGALIHWIYSCTAINGDFDKIMTYLQKITKKYLLIEWVDNKDKAVNSFGHLRRNKEVIIEPYTEDNFVASLKRHFTSCKKVVDVTLTRRLYLCNV